MSNRAYPWNILKIDETDDKKLIKKAYARLIKQYKPEEYPEQFQEINDAYQLAVSEVELLLENPINPSRYNSKGTRDFTIESRVLAQENNESIKQKDVLEEILNNINIACQLNILDRSNINNWVFLKEFNRIDDITIKDNAVMLLFRVIAEKNLEFYEVNGRRLLHHNVLKYMGRVFEWEEYSALFLKHFPEEYISINYSYDDKKTYYQLESYPIEKRLFALFAEFGIANIILRIADYFVNFEYNNKFIFGIFVFTLLRVPLEFLYRNVSIGKIANMALACNKDGSRLSPFKITIRQLIIYLTIAPVIYFFYYQLELNQIWMTIFGSLVAIHLLPYLLVKSFLHDMLTNTQIIWDTQLEFGD